MRVNFARLITVSQRRSCNRPPLNCFAPFVPIVTRATRNLVIPTTPATRGEGSRSSYTSPVISRERRPAATRPVDEGSAFQAPAENPRTSRALGNPRRTLVDGDRSGRISNSFAPIRHPARSERQRSRKGRISDSVAPICHPDRSERHARGEEGSRTASRSAAGSGFESPHLC